MPEQDELRAEYARAIKRLEELQRQLMVTEMLPPNAPPPHRFKRHLGLIDGGKKAAMAAAGAALASAAFIRHHLGATAVVAATAVVLSLTPSLAPHVTELPDERIALPPSPSIAPAPLEPAPELPTLDTGEDTAPGIHRDSAAPEATTVEVEPLDVVDTEQDTPTDTEPPTEPQPPPGRREPPPRREPEPVPPEEPPAPTQCLVVAVPPEVDIPACVDKITRTVPDGLHQGPVVAA